MLLFAIKMLIGDRAKYIGIILGLTFASFIVAQQSAILLGIMQRTYGFITDTSQANIWVMDPEVQYVDDIKGMKSTALYRVRSISGVEWAEPLFKALLQVRLFSGVFQTCIVIGIDEATLIGGPPKMISGTVEKLRYPDAVIVNQVGADTKLASRNLDGKLIPLKIGDVMEINDHRASVVGLCDSTRTFQSQPVIYTTYNRALTIAPQQRKMLSFVLVKAAPGISPEKLCKKIQANTGLAAYTADQFKMRTVRYYIKNTGILVNFAVAVALGFVIGIAIAGQTFYNFTIDNLRFFGTFKAMGAEAPLLVKMVLLQALLAGVMSWGIGIGAAALFGLVSSGTELSFSMPWQLFLGSGAAMLFICLAAAWISILRVIKLDPSIVFKSS